MSGGTIAPNKTKLIINTHQHNFKLVVSTPVSGSVHKPKARVQAEDQRTTWTVQQFLNCNKNMPHLMTTTESFKPKQSDRTTTGTRPAGCGGNKNYKLTGLTTWNQPPGLASTSKATK